MKSLAKHIFWTLLLSVLLAVSILAAEPAVVEEGTCGDNLTWVLYDDGELAISGEGPMTNYTPSSPAPWSSYHTSIQMVTVENGVTFIGEYAFSECASLTTAVIGDDVTSIGKYAFYCCTGLTDVSIGSSVATIGVYTFSGCTGLTDITLPDSLTAIIKYAFRYCSNLTTVTLPDSVTTIGEGSFSNCTGLKEVYYSGSEADRQAMTIGADNSPLINAAWQYVFVPGATEGTCGTEGDNLTWVLHDDGELVISGTGAMKNYTPRVYVPWYFSRDSIQKVTIEDGVTFIGEYAFSDCTALTAAAIGNDVTSIGKYAFYRCTALSDVTFGTSVATIGTYTFSGCTGLTGITLPDSLTAIIKYAFRYCSNLTTVTLPDSVTTIGEGSFSNCTSLSAVYYSGTETDRQAINIAEDNASLVNAAWQYEYEYDPVIASGTCGDNLTWTLYDTGELVISGEGEMYDFQAGDQVEWMWVDEPQAYDTPWWGYETQIKTVVVEPGVTHISDGAFSYLSELTSVSLSEGIEVIGESLFYGCSSLTSVTLPESVMNIGWFAFEQCTALSSVCFKSTTFSVSNRAFSNCPALETVFFAGTEEDRSALTINSQNDALTNAMWYYEVVDPNHYFLSGTISQLEAGSYLLDGETTIASTISVDGVLTLDLNGHALTGTVQPLFTVLPGGTLTIRHPGSFDISGISAPCLVTEENGSLNAYGVHTEYTISGTKANCEEDGWTDSVICTVCREVLVPMEIIGSPGHTEEILPAVAATCTEPGLTEGLHCSICDELMIGQEVVPPLGHTSAFRREGVTLIEYCSVCEEILSEELVADVTLTSAEALPGETVTLTASIAGNPGLAGYLFHITADPDVFSLAFSDGEPNITAGTVCQKGTLDINSVADGWKVIWYHTSNVSTDGTLFSVELTVSEDAPEGEYEIGLVYSAPDTINVDGTYIALAVSGSTVSVSSSLPGDVTGDGKVNNADVIKVARSTIGLETLTEQQKLAADINGDGKVNNADVIKLARSVLGLDVL